MDGEKPWLARIGGGGKFSGKLTVKEALPTVYWNESKGHISFGSRVADMFALTYLPPHHIHQNTLSPRLDDSSWLTVYAVCFWSRLSCNKQGFLARMDPGTCLLALFCLWSKPVCLLTKYRFVCQRITTWRVRYPLNSRCLQLWSFLISVSPFCHYTLFTCATNIH